ncbi:hypothetical protein PLESTF_000093900 [Pleodorina starrii]|nr:hypothetical protein PLESTM_001259800 [Pleodorina starrii]GLC63884.1 hypothetical protein PLESTF_000093900 [Pleodorina starrii]
MKKREEKEEEDEEERRKLMRCFIGEKKAFLLTAGRTGRSRVFWMEGAVRVGRQRQPMTSAAVHAVLFFPNACIVAFRVSCAFEVTRASRGHRIAVPYHSTNKATPPRARRRIAEMRRSAVVAQSERDFVNFQRARRAEVASGGRRVDGAGGR